MIPSREPRSCFRATPRAAFWAVVCVVSLLASSSIQSAFAGRQDGASRRLAKKIASQVVGVQFYEKVKPSTKSGQTALAFEKRKLFTCSGMIWSKEGHIATLFGLELEGLISDGREVAIEIVLGDGRVCDAGIAGVDGLTGVALLKLIDPPKGLKAVKPIADVPEIGATVAALGANFSFHVGVVQSPRYRVYAHNFCLPRGIKTSIPAFPGDIGGMLADESGRLIGMLAFETGSEHGALAIPDWANIERVADRKGQIRGNAVAIPADLLQRIVGELRRRGRVSRGVIGVSMEPIHLSQLSCYQGVHDRVGAYLRWLDPDGPAALAGLEKGDVILQIDDVLLRHKSDLYDFAERVEYGPIGHVFEVQYVRQTELGKGAPKIRRAKLATIALGDPVRQQ